MKTEKLIMKRNLLKHNITQKVYNNEKINDLIFNQNKRIVSIFKDNVIYNDYTEFFFMFYNKYNSLYFLKNLQKDFIKLLYSKDFINFYINKIMNNYYIKVKELKKINKPIRNKLTNSISIKKIIELNEKENNDLSDFLNLDNKINYIQEIDNSKNNLIRQISFISKINDDIIPISDEFLIMENELKDYLSVIKKKENMKVLNICDVFQNNNNKLRHISKKINTIPINKKIFIVRNKKFKNNKFSKNKNGSLIKGSNYTTDKNKINDEILKTPKRCNTEIVKDENIEKKYETIPLNNNSKKIKTISLLNGNEINQKNIYYNNFKEGRLKNKKLIHNKENSKTYYSNYSINTLDFNVKDNNFPSSILQKIQNDYKFKCQNKKNENILQKKYSTQRGESSKKKISLIRKIENNNNFKKK